MVKPWLNHGLKTASLLEAEAHGSSFYATTARLPDAHINKSTRLDLPSGLMTDMTVSGKPEASEPSLRSLRSLRVADLFRGGSWPFFVSCLTWKPCQVHGKAWSRWYSLYPPQRHLWPTSQEEVKQDVYGNEKQNMQPS